MSQERISASGMSGVSMKPKRTMTRKNPSPIDWIFSRRSFAA